MATSCRPHNPYLLHRLLNNAGEENITMNDCHFLYVQNNAESKMAILSTDAILLLRACKFQEVM